MDMRRDLRAPAHITLTVYTFFGGKEIRFIVCTYLIYSLGPVILLMIPVMCNADAQSFQYESLINEVARMACQIPPKDRYAVAVMDPAVDRKELQNCIGRPLAETMVQVLWEFRFTLVKKRLFSETLNWRSRQVKKKIMEIGRNTGARSILFGEVDIEDETVRVAYRMIKIETMEIIGNLSCTLTKKEFKDCFLVYDLTPPKLGIFTHLPQPRRIH